ncbi:MAG: MotA/TolQ/ExbB proton channel family protein [Bdellovibrionales bacterium]|nr:MotA/TolQ/ExbB proton channel family protein [Bdellovibrionales bacterium]
MGLFELITTAFAQGGIWMWAILVAQVFSVAIVAERVWKLYLSRKINNSQIVKQFELDIKSGHLENVIKRAQLMPDRTPISRVLKAGAEAALEMGGREEIQSQMDEVLLYENARLNKRTGLLAMLANTGTLLGLLGTIIGLIQAFSSVSGVDPVEKATLLTKGIALAMNTTAYGLIMAIPALVMFGILQSRANTISEDLNQAALKAFNWLSFKYDSVPQRSVRVKTK